ncbi:MAG TPA: DNA cytosine methyltransferase [Tepidisphaeraceae bacterium]|nr:DNA cytosine methyltransferase [Tepidisphaeraceae bacterium]
MRAIDLFCGAGGSSWGARLAGAKMVGAFDAWELAGQVYKDNFPDAHFFHGRLEEMDLHPVAKRLGKIDLMLASPECTNHGPAKGNRPRCENSKNTAFQVTRFARTLKPRWIVIENVSSMRRWNRYEELIANLTDVGYHIHPQILNSAEFGMPQRRRRLFLLCDLKKQPDPVKLPASTGKTAADIVDLNGAYSYSLLRTDRRAKATIERADRAIDELGDKVPFLLVYYGSDHAGGWQSLNAPLRTITTLDRFAVVKPGPAGHVMRMLQVPELKAAMGMPDKFHFRFGSRRERVKMIGNGVCPPVIKHAIQSLTLRG